MEAKILRELAIKSIGLMLAVFLVSTLITRYNDVIIYANDIKHGSIDPRRSLYYQPENYISFENLSETLASNSSQESMLSTEQGNMEDVLGDNYIRIRKPNNKVLTVRLEDLYITKSINVSIDGLEGQLLSTDSVQSVIRNQQKKDFIIENVELTYINNEENLPYKALYHMTLDRVYVHDLYEDETYIYIDLVDPHKVYDKIIVVDAGHGGTDVGTFTSDLKYYEKDINLSIVLYLKELLEKENIKVYYTRTEDKKVYLNPRVNLANNVKADFFISIHCNSNIDESPYGTQVLYGKTLKNKKIGSKELASICLSQVIKEVGTKDMGKILGDNIYIIDNSKVPVALIEVAFMSNKNDMEYLSKEKNQKNIAVGIYNGIMVAYQEMED